MRPHGIMFHHFWSEVHPKGQGAMSVGELRRVVESLGPERVLPAREFLDRSMRGTLRPWDICLTFDDSLRCQYEVAVPVLSDFGLTAFFFVYTSVLRGVPERLELYRHFRSTRFTSIDAFYAAFFLTLDASAYKPEVDAALEGFDPHTYLAGFPFYTPEDRRFRFTRDHALGPAKYNAVMDQMIAADPAYDPGAAARNLWMTAGQVQQLHRDGHVIGLHSDTHPTRLADLCPAKQELEYQTNYDELRGLLGESPTAMSHPCNSYNPHTLRILRKLGIKLGFRANMAEGIFSADLEMPREDHANLLPRLGSRAA